MAAENQVSGPGATIIAAVVIISPGGINILTFHLLAN